MAKVIPEKIINRCGECPHLKLQAFTGKFYCRAVLRKQLPEVDLETIAEFCPLGETSEPSIEQKRLELYQWAVNRLDDEFEYLLIHGELEPERHKQWVQDQNRVYNVLDELTEKLVILDKESK